MRLAQASRFTIMLSFGIALAGCELAPGPDGAEPAIGTGSEPLLGAAPDPSHHFAMGVCIGALNPDSGLCRVHESGLCRVH